MNVSEDKRLEEKGVRPTVNRILVLRALSEYSHPVSLGDLEGRIGTLDKSSIFRVLNLFAEHHIVHSIEDGSGSLKYEICKGEHECTLSDMHVHFYCEGCHQTFCFEDSPIPAVPLPEGFEVSAINYMVKGLCPRCRGRES
jgi:Fur family ferric uptake transcriptional regulator